MYEDYPIKPYVNSKRNLATEYFKPVPRKNMELLEEELLAGDIILLWRIGFGTFTTETGFPKYFEYTYGIDAPKHLQKLLVRGYVVEETAFHSLNHLNSPQKKAILKQNGVSGLSKLKAGELDKALAENLTEEELASFFTIRGLALTGKGQKALVREAEVIARHPKKNI